ncbi:uncharacterized protein LOC143569840 [Bidens hawaiensis]|uniref:uncharacterized protein LOC143569840 n=1 Tax=Bidens hawaiensis TaxID=980011 RepID=UPI00404A9B88
MRRNNVGKVFDIFDLNRDGGLSRKEVVVFLFVIKPGEDQLSTCVEEIFSMYAKHIDDKKGLTFHGLLQYYDDGRSNLDSDIVPLYSDSDDSDKRKNLIWLFQKLSSDEFGDLKPPVKGFTSSSVLTMDDAVTRDRSDLGSEVLDLLLKPDDEPQAALWFTSPESLDTIKPWTIRAILLYLLIAVVISSIAIMLVKFKHTWLLFLISFNSINVFLNKRKKMH